MYASLSFISTAVAFLLPALKASAAAQTRTTASGSWNLVSSSTITPSTCPSRSFNYITQTLPQQCFTTSWASRATSQEETTESQMPTLYGSKESISATQRAPAETPIQKTDTETHSVNVSPTAIDSSTVAADLRNSLSTTSVDKVAPQSGTLSGADEPLDTDSPFDNANFLSFEDWKRQNLAKAGQSAENLGSRAGGDEPRRRPNGINNALDSLGEDSEIDIDFRGFVNPGASPSSGSPATHATGNDGSTATASDEGGRMTDELSGARRRTKDAGKTCKERSNYASFDCAATMLKTNAESKGSTAVLVENRDSYMLNTCAAKNKYFIVELCDDILIDTVVLANFEFFSSMFRTFRVSVSDRFPVKPDKWKNLGTFEARNSREVQAFLVENPLIWARYLRIEFLTHYGNEYYCPVSLLRVHGTTMMEEFNHDLKRTSTEEDGDNEIEGTEEAKFQSGSGVVGEGASEDRITSDTFESMKQAPVLSASLVGVQEDTSIQSSGSAEHLNSNAGSPHGFTPHELSLSKQMEDLLSTVSNPIELCRPEDRPTDPIPGTPLSLEHSQPLAAIGVTTATSTIASQSSIETKRDPTANLNRPTDTSIPVLPTASEKDPSLDRSDPIRSYNQTSVVAGKTQVSSTQPSGPTPTTQESFFKSVHKRLQLLESNSTLSLQYIEEQSRILRDAFSKVEKRQLAKTTTFLETLNTTVLTELRDFRNQYDQIWQSTVLELSSQREQSQHEVFALSARLSLLADEIVFQKRMVILQFILILLCLGLAIFSRSSPSANYLELPPLVQNAISKSSMSLSRYTPQFETPPASPSSTRPSSRYGLFRGLTHLRGLSDESQLDGAHDGAKNPIIEYSPPTPTSQDSPGGQRNQVAASSGEEDLSDDFAQVEADAVRQTKSSPATPSGN